MALLIWVSPARHGWSVRSEALGVDLEFERGGRAELAARSLAERLAGQGRDAEVRIVLRDGALGGTFTYPAHPPLAWAS